MLGRSVGISEEKLAAVLDDPLPAGVFTDDEAAIVIFARKSTRMEPIDDQTWAALTAHFDTKAVIEIITTVGLNQLVSRFHAAVHTDVDEATLELVAPNCPVRLPPAPGAGASPTPVPT